MNLSVGIVGLPNVGKSTLFNALRKAQGKLSGLAQVGNYAFTTIEPNVGVVPVPDERLIKLRQVCASTLGVEPPIKPATVEFVDIAGLVKGASEGAGLGNKFLSHIREVQIIAHVVRAFADENVIKEGSVDPKSDYQTVNTELMLADLATLDKINLKKHESSRQSRASPEAGIKNYEEVINRLKDNLNKGVAARDVQLTDEEREAIRDLFLLSAKPEIIVLNIAEDEYKPDSITSITQKYSDMLGKNKDQFVMICAKIEAELAELSEEEQKDYLKDLGLEASGLERLIQKAYQKLGLISFLTAGEKEIKAWTLPAGSTAVRASGVIHTDFEKKFIKAEVVSYADYVATGGRKKAREVGKARLEGRDYVVKDGDVVEFKIGS